jgi:hypothetical protein
MSNQRRSFHVSALCLLTSSLGGGLAAGCAYDAESPPTEEVGEAAAAVVIRKAWTAVAAPHREHPGASAVLLGNGKVLVTNGRDNNAEVYDPVTNTWAYTPYVPGNTAYDFKREATAMLLPSGKVVVSTGLPGGAFYGDYDLYDPATSFWSSAPVTSIFAPYWQAGVTLPDGTAVTTGGDANGASLDLIRSFDEPTRTWVTIGHLISGRARHTSTVLDDGSILSVGGINHFTTSAGTLDVADTSLEIFYPATGESLPIWELDTGRYDHAATRLANGKVLITGGTTDGTTRLKSSLLYNPFSHHFSWVGSLAYVHQKHITTLLQDGRVLLSDLFTELYDPATGLWSKGSYMNNTYTIYTATRLADGRVLAVGREDYGVPSAEIYDPSPQCVTFQRGSFGATADAQIGSGNPTKNYGASVVANSGGVAGSIRMALFSFDLSAIPAGSVVTSATLRVYATAFSGAGDEVEVHSVLVPWAETGVTWNSFGNAWEADTLASFFSGTAAGWRSADITGLVRGWQSGAKPNNGVILVQNWMNDHYTSFATGEAALASTRPALEVCFVAP